MGSCLKKQLRAFSFVHAMVKVTAAGGFRLFFTGFAAAVVSHSRSPNFLRLNRSRRAVFIKVFVGRQRTHYAFKVLVEIVACHQIIPGLGVLQAVKLPFLFYNSACLCAVKLHRFS